MNARIAKKIIKAWLTDDVYHTPCGDPDREPPKMSRGIYGRRCAAKIKCRRYFYDRFLRRILRMSSKTIAAYPYMAVYFTEMARSISFEVPMNHELVELAEMAESDGE